MTTTEVLLVAVCITLTALLLSELMK